MPEVGEPAPDFTLDSTIGQIKLRRHLSDRRLVLGFYIEDKTPG